MQKLYEVVVIRAPECKRGWLAYTKRFADMHGMTKRDDTLVVDVMADNAQQAKSRAITLMRNLGKPASTTLKGWQ